MKCPACKKSHKRSGGPRCSCGYQFVFYAPKGAPKPEMTDARFEALVRRVSRNGTLYFTADQLATANAEFSYRGRPGWGCASFALIVLIIGVWAWTEQAIVGFILLGIALLGVLGVVFGRQHTPPEKSVTARSIQKWKNAGRPLPMLLEQPSLSKPPQEWSEPDIYDYGVERVLFVQHPLLVDLFVRNGLFAEQKALIISETGYPEYLLPHVERILSETEQLPVFLLHDSDPTGMKMRLRLTAQKRFHLDKHQLIDLGISPSGVQKLKRLQALSPKDKDYQLSATALPYGMLQAGVAMGMLELTSMAELLAQKDAKDQAAMGAMDFG